MADVAKFALRFEQSFEAPPAGEAPIPLVCTFHVRAEDDYTLDESALAGLNAAVTEWWQVGVDDFVEARALFAGVTKLIDVTSRRISPTVSDPVVGALFADNRGTSGGTAAPPQTSLLVNLRGITETRRTRGRMYLPPPSMTYVDALGNLSILPGQIYQQARNLGPSLAAAIRNFDAVDPDPGPCLLVVWSRVAGSSQAVTHFRYCRALAVQRRRFREPRLYTDVGLLGEVF